MFRLPHFITLAAQGQTPPGTTRLPLLGAQTWAEMPALAALAVAVGAGATALAHAVALPDFTGQFWLAAVVGLMFCVASHWDYPGPRPRGRSALGAVRRVLGAGLALGLFLLPPLCAWLNLGNGQWFVPLDVLTDGNLLVAVFLGWIMIAGVFAVSAAPPQASLAAVHAAARGRATAGSGTASVRSLPLSAPLLPGLSLFGVLHVVSVDTIISVCFLFFVAAAMYLVAYESQFNRLSLVVSPPAIAAHPGDAAGTVAAVNDTPGAIAQAQRMAGQYVLLSAVWLGLFALGAVLLYYPLTAVLPIHISGGFSRARTGSPLASFDWRSPSQIMQLRGGFYLLSDEEVLQVAVESGTPSGLLRGKTFAFYNQSPVGTQWEETAFSQQIAKTLRLERGQPVQLKPPLPPQVAGTLSRRVVVEQVRPLTLRGNDVLYASGEPFATQGNFRELSVMANGTVYVPGSPSSGADAQYAVQSQVTTPRQAALRQARGLAREQLRAWRSDAHLAPLLQTGSAQTTARLQQLAAQIIAAARARGEAVTTPLQKVQAVEKYLIQTCEYSLDTPFVPNGQDAVLFFLTESRLGACDMFASAMALLLRVMNVPTRIATGFRQPQEMPQMVPAPNALPNAASGSSPVNSSATGGASGDNASGDLNEAGGVVVRQRDAHAWVEYFVEGYGWLTRDPTDGTREAQPSVGRQIAQALQLRQLRSPRLLLLPGAGAALLLIGALWTVLEKRAASAGPRRAASADELGRARIAAAHAAAVRAVAGRVPLLKLAAAGHTAGHAARTPREIEAAVLSAPLSSAAKQEFAALTYLVIAAHYAADFPASQISSEQLRDCLTRLQRAPQ